MKTTLIIYKYMLQSSFSLKHMLSSFTSSPKKTIGKIALGILLIAALAPTALIYVMIVNGFYDAYAYLGQQNAVIAIFCVGATGVVFFFGLMHVFSCFFSSKDTNLLLSLPVQPKRIGQARLLYVITLEYISVVLLLCPVLAIAAIKSGAGIMFWLYGILTLAFVPVIPISLAAAAVLIVARLFAMKVNVEKVQSVFMVIFVVAMLAISFSTSYSASANPNISEAEMINKLISDNSFLLGMLTKYYFPAGLIGAAFAAKGLFGLLPMMGFVGLSLLSFLAASFISDKCYISVVTVRPVEDSGFKHKKVSKGQLIKDLSRRRSPILALAAADFKVVMRTPIFAFNTIGVVVMMPLILLGLVVFGALSGSQDPDTKIIIDLINSLSNAGIYLAFAAAIGSGFLTSMGSLTSTSFSREGKAIWISRLIPISPYSFVLGRSLSAFITSGAVAALFSIAMCIFLNKGPLLVVASILLSLIASSAPHFIGLAIDAKRPLLNWDNPTRAVKQNFNVVFSMLFSIGYYAILVVCVILLSQVLDSILAVGIAALISAAAGAGCFFYAAKAVKDNLAEN